MQDILGGLMGRIVFEIGENIFELDRDDVEVLKHFQTITGIKAQIKTKTQALPMLCASETGAIDTPSGKPFDDETMTSKEDIAKFIMAHLGGFKIPMVLEHFYGRVPRYGVSEEQNRLLGKFTGRIKRAREAIEQSENGQFVTELKGAEEYIVFKKREPALPEESSVVSQTAVDRQKTLPQEEEEIIIQD